MSGRLGKDEEENAIISLLEAECILEGYAEHCARRGFEAGKRFGLEQSTDNDLEWGMKSEPVEPHHHEAHYEDGVLTRKCDKCGHDLTHESHYLMCKQCSRQYLQGDGTASPLAGVCVRCLTGTFKMEE